ncbi:MAG TPA: protein phosphatase 2C domain-containing protein [Acidimicrobiales bacterium]
MAPSESVDDPDGASSRTTLIAHPEDNPTQSVSPPAAGGDRPTTCTCGGRFEGGWCDTCGAPQPDERDHVVVSISPTLGSVSDRGVVHYPNEDAGTVADLGGPVACIVADGVSSAEGSQAASGAAVAATCAALVEGRSERAGPEPPDWFAALRRSRSAAAAAASSPEVRGEGEAPSCTWVAAVTDGAEVWTAWVGDSRTYLVDDDGHGRCLSTDHSWAAEAIAAGTSRDDAMADRRAHMITAWLGADAPEIPDATARVAVESPGWLLVVSDGLWNYCDAADDLAGLVARLGGPNLDAVALAEALVGYANAAGGADNITVAAARLSGPGPSDTLPTDTPPTDTPPTDVTHVAGDPTLPGA